MKKSLIGLGAVVAVILGGAALAQGMGPHGHGAMMQQMISQRIAKMEDAISATPEQRDQIEQSKQVILNAMAAKRKARQGQHGKLIDALTAPNLDTAALNAMVQQHQQDMADLAKVMIPEIQKVHDILTPQQRATLAAKAKEMQQRHQQHLQQEGGNGQ